MNRDKGAFDYSIIIPALNEEAAITSSLSLVIEALENMSPRYEIIVVNDGSTDRTAEVVRSLAKKNTAISLIDFSKNQGKGAAVRAGMKAARGRVCAFVDGDASVCSDDICRVLGAVDTGSDVAVASLAHQGEKEKQHPKRIRRVLRRIISPISRSLLPMPVKDTQRGLKAFTSEAAKVCFDRSVLDGFAFDVEILLLSQKQRLRVVEVPVEPNWDAAPSSLTPRRALKMVSEFFRVWWRNLLGKYQ